MPRQDKNTLFRRQALANLDDVDELDRLVTVTHPRAWLTLGAVAAIIITALVWASVGRLATTVTGEGILLAGTHITRVTTVEGGQLESLAVSLGEDVTVGQQVAELTMPDAAGTGMLITAVVSPYSGRVVSLQAYPGQYLPAGAPIITVEQVGVPLTATLYVPVESGKRVHVGQEVQVMSASANVNEFGYIPGRVSFVATLPSTPESMEAVLQNQFLVQEFAAAGPALRVEVALKRDPTTPSGYAWSASAGPATRLSAGTTCSARIVLTRDAPIIYAFPALERFLGGE